MAKTCLVELNDMAHGGEAVGRCEGKAIFVAGGIPGEVVRVEVIQDKGRFARGRLVEVVSPSPHRIEPSCPYFGACGGCQWQHIDYPAQVEIKTKIIRSQMQRLAGIDTAPVRPMLAAATPWHYRNHVQFVIDENGVLGYMASGSHRVVPVEHCLLMHTILERLLDSLDIDLPGLRQLALRAGVNTGELMLLLETEHDEPPELEADLAVSCALLVDGGDAVTLLGSPYIHERLGDHTYRVGATSFFQVNTAQAEVLLAQVVTHLNPDPADIILDAYCGVGTFTLPLAERARHVTGIESSLAAMADAQHNAADRANTAFLCGTVEAVAPTLDIRPTLVVADPPRAGLDPQALKALINIRPRRLVYVSCDPATLARDVKGFRAAGYDLIQVQPIDMFPQTHHIESVAVLELS